MVEDVSIGGAVYYGYSVESPGDWDAGIKSLMANLNQAPLISTSTSDEFEVRYGWMSSTNHVVKLEAEDSTRGIAFTIFVNGVGDVWAWLSASASADVNTPNWSGTTTGDFWTTGTAGVATNVSSISLASIKILGSTGIGKKATQAYALMAQGGGAPYIYANDGTTAFTPYQTTLSGSPLSTSAKVTVLGPLHAASLAGVGENAKMLTQASQSIPPGSYSMGNYRFQGVMAGTNGGATLFLPADTDYNTYNEEE